MSKKIIFSALGAICALGIASQTVADTTNAASMKKQKTTKKMLAKQMPKGFDKCYGIAKAGKNDCASGSESCAGGSTTDGAKNAWLGVPKGTCDKIVGGSTSEGSA